MNSLEAICKRFLGKANWRTTETLTPSQMMEGVAMLHEGLPPALVDRAYRILISWGWYRQVGIIKPPWEITGEDAERLAQLSPWSPRNEQPRTEQQQLEFA